MNPSHELITESLQQRFISLFETQPSFLIRAPGRVNLLGEHTDYNGLPTLPLAIDRHIWIAAHPHPRPRVRVYALDWKEEPAAFDLETSIPKHPRGHWVNYVKAGMQGVLTMLGGEAAQNIQGCNLVITGSLPPGSGLSSSSALVVASAVGLLQANRISFNRLKLAQGMAEAEWYVGTRGGGMDQAACLLGEKDHLLKMDFFPLQVEQVPWPPDYCVVICSSGVSAKKSEEALRSYNLRSAECKLALQVIQNHLARSGHTGGLERIGDLLKPPYAYSYSDLDDLVSQSLQESYSMGELVEAIGDEKAVLQVLQDCSLSNDSAYSRMEFLCGKRFRHIVSEGWRVEQARDFLLKGDMQSFGKTMQQGHHSARDDFEISCPELDRLVETALENAALGARLTGAGFGGCTVNVVPVNRVESFVSAMQPICASLQKEDSPEETILVVHPSEGVHIVDL